MKHRSWKKGGGLALAAWGLLAGLGASRAEAQAPVEITPPAANVTASANDGNLPANTVDNSLSTRWSASGDGQWIQFDLGSTRTVTLVKIAFYKGNERNSRFDLQVATSPGAWQDVLTNVSSNGTTLNEESFDFADVPARWVRYFGHGNSANLWNSLTEVSIFAPPPSSDTDITPPGSAATASAQDGTNGPASAVDKNLGTRWSASGDGQWLQLDLGTSKTVAFVKVAVYNGTTRRNRFDIQVSSGGGVWETVFNGESSGTTTALETYNFTDKDARWVRYLGHGNDTSAWNSVTEIEVWGRGGGGGCTPPSGNSALWNNFVQARANGTEPTLPDFSYAGYKRSEEPIPSVSGPIFDVTSFGATPGDSTFDDAGIQAAIDAAEAAGGGVVLFPAGRYLVNPTEDSNHFITIEGSHIVLRGAGSGTGGSEILMVAKKQGGKMFRIGPANGWGATTVANVTANATRETFWVTVDSTSPLAVGQIVVLKHQSTQYNSFYFNGLPLDPDWVRVVQNGAGVHEMHEIAEISGSRVRFKEPLHFTIRLDDTPWRLDAVDPLRELGIEDIRFTGSWDTYPEEFVHHKDWIHDSGWSLISIRETVYAWIRNVEFRHFNDALSTDSVGWMTADNLRFTGKKGHSSVGGRRGYGMLVKNTADTAGTHHGPDTGYNLVGAVYLRFQMNVNATVDNHGGVPHANLLDDVTGGVLFGNGGPIDNYPHTGRYYTLWNFRHRATADRTYDFWDAVNRNSHTFALPIFAGFTSDTSINLGSSSEYQVNESQGTRVTPTSLFEAQLALRLCR
jgi:hypothetical protein